MARREVEEHSHSWVDFPHDGKGLGLDLGVGHSGHGACVSTSQNLHWPGQCSVEPEQGVEPRHWDVGCGCPNQCLKY